MTESAENLAPPLALASTPDASSSGGLVRAGEDPGGLQTSGVREHEQPGDQACKGASCGWPRRSTRGMSFVAQAHGGSLVRRARRGCRLLVLGVSTREGGPSLPVQPWPVRGSVEPGLPFSTGHSKVDLWCPWEKSGLSPTDPGSSTGQRRSPLPCGGGIRCCPLEAAWSWGGGERLVCLPVFEAAGAGLAVGRGDARCRCRCRCRSGVVPQWHSGHPAPARWFRGVGGVVRYRVGSLAARAPLSIQAMNPVGFRRCSSSR